MVHLLEVVNFSMMWYTYMVHSTVMVLGNPDLYMMWLVKVRDSQHRKIQTGMALAHLKK